MTTSPDPILDSSIARTGNPNLDLRQRAGYVMGPLEPVMPGSDYVGGDVYYDLLGRFYEAVIRGERRMRVGDDQATDLAYAIHLAVVDGARRRHDRRVSL